MDVAVDHARRRHEAVTAGFGGRLVAGGEIGLLANRHDLAAAHRHRTVADDVAVWVHRDDVARTDQHVDRFAARGGPVTSLGFGRGRHVPAFLWRDGVGLVPTKICWAPMGSMSRIDSSPASCSQPDICS